MIDLKNVTKRYPNGTVALKDVNLHIDDGEFVFITGPSGAGKSTLIKLLLREEEATGGTIKVNDYILNKIPNRKIPYYRRTLGVIFQDFKLFETSTAYENVAFAMRVVGAKESHIRSKVPALLDIVGLEGKENNFPDELSGGEQQRVCIARALANNPKIIIADEPTANVHEDLKWDIMELLMQLNQRGKIVIVITHDQEFIRATDKRVIRIEDGGIVTGVYGDISEFGGQS